MAASLSSSTLLRNLYKTNPLRFAWKRQLSVTSTRWSAQSPVGFIGLGNMGGHMARNLLQKGYPVVIFDLVPESVSALQKDGASSVSSPADVAAQTTQIVTMLPSSPHVLEVYSGSDGIFSKLQKGTLLIDSSTIDPMVSQQMHQAAANKGAAFVDAPVSGGVLAAKGATLTFMVGGPEKDFAAAKEILQHMGKNIVHCGDVGSGQAAKICNNTLLAISMIGTAETMNLGIKLGLDPKVLAGILNTSSGRCWSSEVYNPVPGVIEGVPSSNNYQGGFGTALMTKDLGLAQAAATETQSPLPMGSLAHQIYRMMCKKGYAGRDFSSAYKFISEDA